MDRQTYRWTNEQMGRHTDGQMNEQTDRWTDKWTDEWTDRQTDYVYQQETVVQLPSVSNPAILQCHYTAPSSGWAQDTLH